MIYVSGDVQVLGLLPHDEGSLGQTGPVETVQQKPCPHSVPTFLSLNKIAQNCFAEYFSLVLSCIQKVSAAQGRMCQDHSLCREALALRK